MKHDTIPTLAAGQSIEVTILPGLTYTITNTGWNLTVLCNQRVNLSPISEKAIAISAHAEEAIDKFLGIDQT